MRELYFNLKIAKNKNKKSHIAQLYETINFNFYNFRTKHMMNNYIFYFLMFCSFTFFCLFNFVPSKPEGTAVEHRETSLMTFSQEELERNGEMV